MGITLISHECKSNTRAKISQKIRVYTIDGKFFFSSFLIRLCLHVLLFGSSPYLSRKMRYYGSAERSNSGIARAIFTPRVRLIFAPRVHFLRNFFLMYGVVIKGECKFTSSIGLHWPDYNSSVVRPSFLATLVPMISFFFFRYGGTRSVRRNWIQVFWVFAFKVEKFS